MRIVRQMVLHLQKVMVGQEGEGGKNLILLATKFQRKSRNKVIWKTIPQMMKYTMLMFTLFMLMTVLTRVMKKVGP